MLKTDAIIHNYHGSPFIVRSCVNMRHKYNDGTTRIWMQVPLRDETAARAWLARVYPSVPVRVINHKF